MLPLFPVLLVVFPTPPLPPNFMPFFLNTLNPVSPDHMYMGVRLSMGVVTPQEKKRSPTSAAANCQQLRRRTGPGEHLPICAGFWWAWCPGADPDMFPFIAVFYIPTYLVTDALRFTSIWFLTLSTWSCFLFFSSLFLSSFAPVFSLLSCYNVLVFWFGN